MENAPELKAAPAATSAGQTCCSAGATGGSVNRRTLYIGLGIGAAADDEGPLFAHANPRADLASAFPEVSDRSITITYDKAYVDWEVQFNLGVAAQFSGSITPTTFNLPGIRVNLRTEGDGLLPPADVWKWKT